MLPAEKGTTIRTVWLGKSLCADAVVASAGALQFFAGWVGLEFGFEVGEARDLVLGIVDEENALRQV